MLETTSFATRRAQERFDRNELEAFQLTRLNTLLTTILPSNAFYADKLSEVRLPIQSLADFATLPITRKQELVDEQQPFAKNLTHPPAQYTRFHRTSGTHGRPMIVLDTAADWQCWLDIWQFVLDAAELTDEDRVLMAFSFGPFIGFWSANDAIADRGSLVVPAGGLSSVARLDLLETAQATVICCTPSYAMRLAEVATEQGIDVRNSTVSRIIVAGEPGGSVPSIRKRIEDAWDARVVDHSGATEVGPWGYADANDKGLHIIETEFLAEFVSVETGKPATEGELSELYLTTLRRFGCPVIRYRTGDLVRPQWNYSGENRFVFLDGGVLGRADDMLVIRGVNIFPSAVEQIVCSFPEVAEYRITAKKNGEMDAMSVEVEDGLQDPGRIAKELNVRLGLAVEVTCVAAGELPRFEGKGRRFVDTRK